MERSEQVRQLVIEFCVAVNDRDEAAVKDRYSSGPGASLVGTDAHEYFVGGDQVLSALTAQFAEYPDATLEPGDVVAFEAGDAGWFTDRPVLRWGDLELPTRLSGTAVREGGRWVMAQTHLSVARPE
ncbi:MAG: nuclear transport factor 2 family protein [Actinomycetota bacterium]|jgi:hypothetical protein